ncbi:MULTISPECIES: sialidase family protein [unclassified Imperialibacter]|uniref:sialidase family protein n=1 Tax=unclassified Imperialibacter TaxID=2629706 RepID=UPI0012565BAC|nr:MULTISPECIES: sialidase family protein [unclassified Imperialibacter]CAD5251396.1 hypothetical protein IMPERIA89_120127 [Imperialibacter sp. 89]CAD5284535.1 hypothetical protein IMPERIA75_550126 [Imperialibacter sp. 75]VVT11254.1 hypothetical protein IMPR6_190126 [Imperialibacter sp. EC-SDR9]
MKNLSLMLLTLLVLAGCGKDDDPEGDLASSIGAFNLAVAQFGQFPIQSIAVSPNQQYMAVKVASVTNTAVSFYYSEDAGATWNEFTSTANNFTRSVPYQVSNDGQVLLKYDKNFYLFDGTSLGTVQHPEGGYYDSAYLDEAGNLYYFIGCNCSVSSLNKLSVKKKGASAFEAVEIPANSAYFDVAAGGGIYFINSQSGDMSKYHPTTNQWTVIQGIAQGLPNKKQAAGADGNFYFTNSTGVTKVTPGGSITQMAFKGEMTNYQNPLELRVSTSGRVFVLLAAPNGIYEYTGGAWESVGKAGYHNNISGGIFSIAMAGEAIYYAGAAEGGLAYGLVEHDLDAEEKKVVGQALVSQEATLYDAIEASNGKTFVILNGGLYEMLADQLIVPVDLGQSTTLSTLYEDLEGNLYAFGNNVYRSSDGGTTWKEASIGFPSYSGHSVQQLSDGSLIAIAGYNYDYYLGGTGFSVPKFSAYVSKSTDGISWSASSILFEGGSQYVTCIDKEGILFGVRVDVNGNYQQFNQGIRSDDGGQTWNDIEGKVPDLVGNNGSLFSVKGVGAVEGLTGQRFIYKWNGEEWLELPSEIEQSGQLYTIKRVHQLKDKRLYFSTSAEAFKSLKTY